MKQREWTRRWRLAHPEHVTAYREVYVAANLDVLRKKACERMRRLRAEDPVQAKERAREVNRRFYGAHRDGLLTRAKARYRSLTATPANREIFREKRRFAQGQRPLQSRLAANLRGRLLSAIRIGSRSGSAVRDLGCLIEQLKRYLDARFRPGMTWENWGRYGWHIDHVKPLASFDLTDRAQFLAATHYTNLQPLWAVDNLTKSRRWA